MTEKRSPAPGGVGSDADAMTADSAVAFSAANLAPALHGHKVSSVLEVGWGTETLRRSLSGGNGSGFAVYDLESLGSEDPESAALATPLKSAPLADGRLWRPDGWGSPYDAVVSVNLLHRVPIEHLVAVLTNMRRHAKRLCFLAIGLAEDSDSIAAPEQPPAVTVRSPQWWLSALQQAGFRLLDHRVQRDRAGEGDLWLYVYLAPGEPAAAEAATGARPKGVKPLPIDKPTAPQLIEVAMQAHRTGRADEAETLYKEVLVKDADNADALHGLGMLACDRDALDEGEALIRRAIALDNEKPSYHSNLGHLLKLRRDFEGALAAHEKAVTLAPKSAEALNNLGDTLRDAGKIEDARDALLSAIEANPNLVTARWNLCQVELTRGDFERGWALMRWGFETRSRKWYGLPLPEYAGESLGTGGVVLWGDWGIGDQVMFTRLIPRLLERVANCVFICDERLVPILSCSFPDVRFQPPIDPMTVRQHYPEVTHHLAISDLGRILCPDPAALGDGGAFLEADEARARALRESYRTGTEGRLIGIAWIGGGKQETRAQRSIELAAWQPILTAPGVRFVSLQNGDPTDDIARAAELFGVEIVQDRGIDQMKSLEDFCAQIAALDLVVSVDCTTVHLSGALGVPTKVLLPYVPDWRWGLKAKATPWYDCLELFRQTTNGDWEGPIARVAVSL